MKLVLFECVLKLFCLIQTLLHPNALPPFCQALKITKIKLNYAWDSPYLSLYRGCWNGNGGSMFQMALRSASQLDGPRFVATPSSSQLCLRPWRTSFWVTPPKCRPATAAAAASPRNSSRWFCRQCRQARWCACSTRPTTRCPTSAESASASPAAATRPSNSFPTTRWRSPTRRPGQSRRPCAASVADQFQRLPKPLRRRIPVWNENWRRIRNWATLRRSCWNRTRLRVGWWRKWSAKPGRTAPSFGWRSRDFSGTIPACPEWSSIFHSRSNSRLRCAVQVLRVVLEHRFKLSQLADSENFLKSVFFHRNSFTTVNFNQLQ